MFLKSACAVFCNDDDIYVLIASALDRCNCPGSRCANIANTSDRCRCCIYVVLGKRSGESSDFASQNLSPSGEENMAPYVTEYSNIPKFYGNRRKGTDDDYEKLPYGIFTIHRNPTFNNRFY
ncbi:hypothetical protein CHS0354_034639 [Potamilus streckersoni]|uniref:Uncharacterized protein n=1 Tax=Potamilus streckersoni TaxID=2493646 RepID=A0AAE0WAM9_9BIVA|nr:hypothetical protein CHS0354_034639 [Potamilus streckersoni]